MTSLAGMMGMGGVGRALISYPLGLPHVCGGVP